MNNVEETYPISLWFDNHPRQEEFNALTDKLVPDSGDAPTVHGELIRIVNRLVYELGNNGNGNLLNEHTCSYCGGDGEYEEEDEEDGIYKETCPDCDGWGFDTYRGRYSIDRYYFRMFKFLELYINEKVVMELVDYIKDGGDQLFERYNEITDEVLDYIGNHEDEPNQYIDKNPPFYKW